jgi:hypothetical protein
MMKAISNTIKTNVEKTAQTIRTNAPSVAKTAVRVGTVFAVTGAISAVGLNGLSHPSLNRKNLQPMHVLSIRK